MNVIVLMSDTFRADHVNAYNLPAPWSRPGHETESFIETPCLDKLASDSTLFERFYTSSYPTIPCRLDLFTGRYNFPTRGWEPLRPNDVIISEVLARNGYVTEMIFDTPPLADDGYNYTRGFTGWDWARGQHCDRWITDPIEIKLPCAPHKIKDVEALRPYLLNSSRRQYERDWSCAKTMITAMEWLERNSSHEKFFLYVDTWDPHEPFDAPKWYLDRYADPSYDGEHVIYPMYGRPDYFSEDEIIDVRNRYAAKASLADHWIGKLLDRIADLNLRQNTLVVFLSDHGHLFSEHNLQGKPTGPLGTLYEPSIRIPLLIRHPDGVGSGKRVKAYAQPVDIFPTILDCAGIAIPATVQGKSLLPVLKGGSEKVRDFAFSGRHSSSVGASSFDGWAGSDFISEPLTVTSEKWCLICPPSGGGSPELYDLIHDPSQEKNILSKNSGEAIKLHEALIRFLRQNGANEERIRVYDWPSSALPTTDKRKGYAGAMKFFVISIGGISFAFPTEDEAIAVKPDNSSVIQQTILGSLAREENKVLVCLGGQYYWPQDILTN